MVAISITSTEPPILNPSAFNPMFLKSEWAQESPVVLINLQIPILLCWSPFCGLGGRTSSQADDSDVGSWGHTCCPRPVSASWEKEELTQSSSVLVPTLEAAPSGGNSWLGGAPLSSPPRVCAVGSKVSWCRASWDVVSPLKVRVGRHLCTHLILLPCFSVEETEAERENDL